MDSLGISGAALTHANVSSSWIILSTRIREEEQELREEEEKVLGSILIAANLGCVHGLSSCSLIATWPLRILSEEPSPSPAILPTRVEKLSEVTGPFYPYNDWSRCTRLSEWPDEEARPGGVMF